MKKYCWEDVSLKVYSWGEHSLGPHKDDRSMLATISASYPGVNERNGLSLSYETTNAKNRESSCPA